MAVAADAGPDVDQRLNRTFAEALLSHDDCTMVVLQRAGYDLRSRGGTGIDQHHDRQAARRIAETGEVTLDVIRSTAALRNYLAPLQENVSDADGLVEQPPGIRPQVDHVT